MYCIETKHLGHFYSTSTYPVASREIIDGKEFIAKLKYVLCYIITEFNKNTDS